MQRLLACPDVGKPPDVDFCLARVSTLDLLKMLGLATCTP